MTNFFSDDDLTRIPPKESNLYTDDCFYHFGDDMSKDISANVSKQLQEFDSILNEVLKQQILPDRTYTQITLKIGHIDSHYMNDQFKQSDPNYYNWVKTRLDKLSKLLMSLPKHSTTSFSIPDEDLMHVTGDYYNEDNSISLTQDIKDAIATITNEKYKS
jgi:hypothetical protein